MGKPKIFVLDTNVILHDHKAIRKFRENNLVIPVAVIEEIDKFKKGTDTLSYNARGFMRDLDRITNGKDFGEGFDVVVVEGVARHGEVHSDVVLGGGEGQIPSVGGEDAAAHGFSGVHSGHLDVVFVVTDALVEELQLYYPSHSYESYQEEQEIQEAYSDNVISHLSPISFSEDPPGPSGP